MIFIPFKRSGKDARGVPKIEGAWTRSSKRWLLFWTLFYSSSLILYARDFSKGPTNHYKFGMGLYMTIFSCFMLLIAARNFSLRQKTKKLTNADAISSRFGVEAERLTTFAEKQGIKPRYNINGEDFYDLKDFGDAAVLLRASVAPAAQPETLLRPAAGTPPQIENLLRPSASPQTAPTTQNETQALTNGRSNTPA